MSARATTAAAIVSVGNELLYGETIDTNAAWMGRALAARGILVVRRFTVGDVEADIQGALTSAMLTARLVFITGGLGPTPDDVTKLAVSRLFERRTVTGDEHLEVPEDAQLLRNPLGTAPGLVLHEDGAAVVLLPGVPRELRAVFEGDLQKVLDEVVGVSDGGGLHHHVVHTTGIPEPRLAELLEARLRGISDEVTKGVALAYLPDLFGVDLRFTIVGGTEQEARARFERLLVETTPVLGAWSFHAESGDLVEGVSEALREAGLTIAVAESCTGGLLAKRLTDRAGAGDVFLGGVIAYADAVKIAQLGVTAADLGQHGAVSDVVARKLATGVAERLGADVGVGITGIAGPDGGSDEKPVGTVWIGVVIDGTVGVARHRFAGDREAVRERAAQAALAQVYRALILRRGRG